MGKGGGKPSLSAESDDTHQGNYCHSQRNDVAIAVLTLGIGKKMTPRQLPSGKCNNRSKNFFLPSKTEKIVFLCITESIFCFQSRA